MISLPLLPLLWLLLFLLYIINKDAVRGIVSILEGRTSVRVRPASLAARVEFDDDDHHDDDDDGGTDDDGSDDGDTDDDGTDDDGWSTSEPSPSPTQEPIPDESSPGICAPDYHKGGLECSVDDFDYCTELGDQNVIRV